MPKLNLLNDKFFVSTQILPSDFLDFEKAGIKIIICNRPDNESADQPSFAQLEKIAEKHNIKMHYLPINPSNFDFSVSEPFAKILDNAKEDEKVLAYCKSGLRSISLWAIGEINKTPATKIHKIANRAGYDLTMLKSFYKELDI